MSKFSCESVFILIHAVVLLLSLNLHQLVWSPSGILLFLAPTLLYSYHGFTWHHLNECTIQLGNLQSLFIWWEIRAGDTCHSSSYIDAALSNHLTESRTRAQEHPAKAVAQHPWGATLGALDLIADVRFSGTLMWFCFFSLSLEPWCRYQDLFFFIIIVIIFTGSEGCLAHNAAKPSVCYFCCFMMWPSCYVTRDMGVLLRPSQGTGVTVRDQGRGLMSTFYIQGGEPQACCHVVLHALPLSYRNSLAHSLTRVLAHRQCGGK